MDCARCNTLMELHTAEDGSEFWWCPMCLYTEDLPEREIEDLTPDEVHEILRDAYDPETGSFDL